MKASKMQLHCARPIVAIALGCLIMLLGACGPSYMTGKMALNFDNPPASERVNSLVLFLMRFENQVAPSYKPCLGNLIITSNNPQFACSFEAQKTVTESDLPYHDYLVSLYLQPGSYVIEKVTGSAYNLLFNGQFRFPVNLGLEVPAHSIVYGGRIEMTNREHQDGEIRSGKMLPLLDQSASGFYSGTFDVVIKDENEADRVTFEENFPWLRNKEVVTRIMTKVQPVAGAEVKTEQPEKEVPIVP
jgi:hypothetical protein